MVYDLDSPEIPTKLAEPTPAPEALPADSSETFCSYLARQFVAKKGFAASNIPEVQKLVGSSDFVLTRSNSFGLTILCMVDREKYPGESFGLDVNEVRQIGDACLKHAVKIGPARMPVFIRIMEIGPGATVRQQQRLQQFKRSSWTAKVVPSAMIIDPAAGQAWNSEKRRFYKGGYQGFVEKMLAAPREAVADQRPSQINVAAPLFPILTVAILAVLIAAFAIELLLGIGPTTKLLQPTVTTLLAFGGLTRLGVLQYGEWYRLLSAPILHLDALSLAMNAVALLILGWRLESLIGRAWFGTIYLAGALGGSLLSLALNPPSVIAVGASGAIMALLAATLIASAHFPSGAIRTRLWFSSILALIVALLPLLAASFRDQPVDYAAHLGGTLAGLLVSLVMFKVWSRAEPQPGFRRAAMAVAVAGAVALAYPAIAIPRVYRAMAFITQLIPADQVPKSSAEMRSRAASLVAQYPRDPRPRFLRTADMLDANDFTGAEREARAALADEDLWRPILSPQLGNTLRIMLAVAINGDRPEEARETVRPACAAIREGPMRKLLDDRKLCSN